MKDERIKQLEGAVRTALANEGKMEAKHREMKEQVRKWKERAEELDSNQEFLKKKTLEAKRKNKLLKTALQHIQLSNA